jgi:hypothetical protein
MTPQSAEDSPSSDARGRELEEPEDGAEPAAGGVQFHQPSRAILPAHLERAAEQGFTCGHASWPQVVELMERIEIITLTHGKRYGSPLTGSPRHRGAARTPLVSMISSESVDFDLILRPGLYATRAKCHGYCDGAVDAVRAHLNTFDIADFDTALLYLGVEQRPVLGAESVRHSGY